MLSILGLTVTIWLIFTVSIPSKAAGFSFVAPMKLDSLSVGQAKDPIPTKPLILNDELDEYPLGLYMELLEDPGGELTIDQVSSPEFDEQFTSSQVEVPNYGLTDSVYWVRLKLDNQSQQINEWLLEAGFANTHYLDLYTPSPDGKDYSVKQSGVLRPPSSRDVFYPNLVFKLNLPPNSQETIYLRFQSGASMTLPLTLRTQPAFFNYALKEQIGYGIFFGILIGLLFYNLFLLFSIREANYLYFVIVLTAFILQEATYGGYLVILVETYGYLFQSFAQELSFSLLIVSIILFADSFLELKRQLPRLHKLNFVFLAAWGGLLLLTPFVHYRVIASIGIPLAIVSIGLVFIAGLITLLHGFRSARFFMVAWLGILFGLIQVMLVRLGYSSSSFLTENAYRFGLMWMAICWSIALADRINLLKAETETANRNLESSKHRLSQILEGLPIGVVVYGKDRKPTFGNRRTAEILSNPDRGIQVDISAGRTLESAIDYFSLQKAGSGEAYPLEKFPVHAALGGIAASADDIEAKLGDNPVSLEIWASPVRDEMGNVESAVAAFQDVTDRKQAEAELAEYRRNLEVLVSERTEELQASNQRLAIEATERKLLELSLQQRIEWLSAVNTTHQTLGGTASLPAIYEALSAKILSLTDAAGVLILHWDSPGKQPELTNYSARDGFVEDIHTLKDAFHQGTALRQEIETGKTITWDSGQEDVSVPAPLIDLFQRYNIQSMILAPMIDRQSAVGVLGVASPKPAKDLVPQYVDLVNRMAFDLTDLAQDALFLDQALALATADERNRLARDLHDSVTQVLFSANLVAEVLPQIWQRDPERGLQSLDRLRRHTRGALAEMRTMLLELRPSAVVNTPLSELLAQLTEAITSRTGLPFQLFIERVPPLPENVHNSFYRIAQEALNNVVKHAQARQVSISLCAIRLRGDSEGVPDPVIEMVIQDDGVGFPAEDEHSAHLGIGIMRERASAIQANLKIESRPGHGTKVSLIWRNPSKKQL